MILATLVACSPGDEVTGVIDVPTNQSQPINFGVGCAEDAATRANGKQPLNNAYLPNEGYHFGLFAAYTGLNDFNDYKTNTEIATPIVGNYIKNMEFLYHKTNQYWYGRTRCYWPLSDSYGGNQQKLSFFAYAPFDQSNQVSIANGYTGGPLMLDIKVGPVATQYDLCVAKPLLDRVYKPYVGNEEYYKLEFKHTLTNIKFEAKYHVSGGGAIRDGMTVRIDELILKDVIGHKVLTYNVDETATPNTEKPWLDVFSWSADADHTAVDDDWTEYSATIDAHQLITEYLSTSYKSLQVVPGGFMYLLPQTLTERDAVVEVIFSLWKNDKDRVAMMSKEIVLPTTRKDTNGDIVPYEWEPGHTVTYSITLDLTNLTAINATVQAETFMGTDPDPETGNSQHYE